MTRARARARVAMEDLAWGAAVSAAFALVLGIAWAGSFLVEPVTRWSLP